MDNITKVMLSGIVGIGLFLIGFGFFGYSYPDYSGKEVFNTQQEYTAFKQAVGAEEVKIRDLDVLSSDPPIIVQFTVSAQRDFPYGDMGTLFPIFSWIAGAATVGAGIWGIRNLNTDKEEVE